ncbi:MAG: response regulator transcription factor [Verrucomicrobiae bacterium]|nr:response regulator transcription factor [Verrucomicrobiae bacterium]
MIRAGLRSLLGNARGIEMVGEAATAAEGLALARHVQPTLVPLDLRLPDMNGLEVCRRLKELMPAPAVVRAHLLCRRRLGRRRHRRGSGRLFAQGCGQRGSARRAPQGHGWRHGSGSSQRRRFGRGRAAAGRPGQPFHPLERLSAQERRVLALVAEGRTNKEVAETLRLGEGTVKNYLGRIFGKLGVKNRTEAVGLWIKRGGQ